jgi:hypothetical protein
MDHALAAAILSVEELPGADPAVIRKVLGHLVAACSSAFVRTRARDCRLSGQRRKIVTECRLDPGTIFCLGRNVPPEEDQALGNRIGPKSSAKTQTNKPNQTMKTARRDL